MHQVRLGRSTRLDSGEGLGTLEGLGRGYGSLPKGSGFDPLLEENGCQAMGLRRSHEVFPLSYQPFLPLLTTLRLVFLFLPGLSSSSYQAFFLFLPDLSSLPDTGRERYSSSIALLSFPSSQPLPLFPAHIFSLSLSKRLTSLSSHLSCSHNTATHTRSLMLTQSLTRG